MLPPKYLILFADVRKNGCKGMSCLQRNDQLSVTQYISGNIPHPVSQPDSLATYGVNPYLSAFFVDMSCQLLTQHASPIKRKSLSVVTLFIFLFSFWVGFPNIIYWRISPKNLS